MVNKVLADGLVLRSLNQGTPADKANLPQFYYDVFVGDYGEEDAGIKPLAEDMLANNPAITDDDVWVVVDPVNDERIVSALLLIPQIWFYEDVEVGVGRIELVATHSDYRRRGLVRELMNTAHERSANLGHLMQSITGIPYYYRKFGYGMTVDLGGVGAIPFTAITDIPDEPSFILRPAVDEDISTLIELDSFGRRDSLLSAKRDVPEWQYELHGKRVDTDDYHHILLIVDANQAIVGYVAFDISPTGKAVRLNNFVVNDKTSYVATYLPVLQAVKKYVQEFFAEKETSPNYLHLGTSMHPDLLKLLDLTPYGKVSGRRYTWYLRVPDIAVFIMQIKSVLEHRLEGSAGHRYSGEIKINFRNFTGLILKFEDGKLLEVENKEPEYLKSNAAFPFYSFLDLLFGYRSMDELVRMYADAFARRDIFVLLDILFPKKYSGLMPIT